MDYIYSVLYTISCQLKLEAEMIKLHVYIRTNFLVVLKPEIKVVYLTEQLLSHQQSVALLV